MGTTSTAVDNYIESAPEFARPLLVKLREIVHQACPDIEERIKWGHPSFEYKGIVGGMAFFKNHVDFRFDKGRLLEDPEGLFSVKGNTCVSAIQPRCLSDLPDASVLVDYLERAVLLNEQGIKVKPEKKPVVIPEYFAALLAENDAAKAHFEAFAPSYQRDYIEWFEQAKREQTRQNRLSQAMEWIAEGKTRNWKYQK